VEAARGQFCADRSIAYLGTGKLDLRRLRELALELTGASQMIYSESNRLIRRTIITAVALVVWFYTQSLIGARPCLPRASGIGFTNSQSHGMPIS